MKSCTQSGDHLDGKLSLPAENAGNHSFVAYLWQVRPGKAVLNHQRPDKINSGQCSATLIKGFETNGAALIALNRIAQRIQQRLLDTIKLLPIRQLIDCRKRFLVIFIRIDVMNEMRSLSIHVQAKIINSTSQFADDDVVQNPLSYPSIHGLIPVLCV